METSQLRDRLCFAVETSSELCAQKVLKGRRRCLSFFIYRLILSLHKSSTRESESNKEQKTENVCRGGGISENVAFMSSGCASRFQ